MKFNNEETITKTNINDVKEDIKDVAIIVMFITIIATIAMIAFGMWWYYITAFTGRFDYIGEFAASLLVVAMINVFIMASAIDLIRKVVYKKIKKY